MTVSKAQMEATARYEAKVYDKILLRLPKGRKEVIQAHAQANGETVNGFVSRAITETLEREGVTLEVGDMTAPASADRSARDD